MDMATLLGMVLSVTSISIGDILEGGNPIHVIHLSSCMIVIPTAMMASMTATNKRYVGPAFKELGIVFKGSGVDLNKRIEELVGYSQLARKDGILALEAKAANIDNEFLKILVKDMLKVPKILDFKGKMPNFLDFLGENDYNFYRRR